MTGSQERTWEERVCDLLQRLADYYEDTDAPLGVEARELLQERRCGAPCDGKGVER